MSLDPDRRRRADAFDARLTAAVRSLEWLADNVERSEPISTEQFGQWSAALKRIADRANAADAGLDRFFPGL
jgi:hypothetical protein